MLLKKTNIEEKLQRIKRKEKSEKTDPTGKKKETKGGNS